MMLKVVIIFFLSLTIDAQLDQVFKKSKSSNELRSIFKQDIKGNDGYKIKKADDKILPRDGISSLVTFGFHSMEIRLIVLRAFIISQ